MKTLKILLLPLLFVLSSCYIYKPYQFKEVDQSASKSMRPGGAVSLRNNDGKVNPQTNPQIDARNQKETALKMEEERLKSEQKKMQTQDINAGSKDGKDVPAKSSFSSGRTPDPNENSALSETSGFSESISGLDSLKIKIQPTKYYKITAEGKQYKIQADQWEGDTLVSHILRKPNKVLRFHQNQIDEETLMERRFSKPFSDLFTVGAYVAGGAAILLLVL